MSSITIATSNFQQNCIHRELLVHLMTAVKKSHERERRPGGGRVLGKSKSEHAGTLAMIVEGKKGGLISRRYKGGRKVDCAFLALSNPSRFCFR